MSEHAGTAPHCAFILVAAFCVPLQPAAFALGFVSVISFLWLARSVGGYNAQVGRVFAADIVALISLVVGVGAYVTQRVL